MSPSVYHDGGNDGSVQKPGFSFTKEFNAKMIDDVFDHSSGLVNYIFDNAFIAGKASISELYCRGSLNLHVHFTVTAKLKSEHFCSIFRRLPFGFGNLMGKDAATRCNGKGHGLALVTEDDQNAVFVGIVDLCEVPQRSSIRHVGSAVRLNVLNLCKSRTTDEWCDFSLGNICKINRTDTDGEKGVACSLCSTAVQNGELINEMVEGRAEVVNAISSDQGKGGVKRLALVPLDDNELPFNLSFVGRRGVISIRNIQCQSDSFVQIDEVMLRSVYLGSYPCQ